MTLLAQIQRLKFSKKQPAQPDKEQKQELLEAFDQLYRRTHDIASFAEKLSEEHGDDQDFELVGLSDSDEDATVVKLLQSIFEDAVQVKASDIHIEPEKRLVRIRQRVDGILQESVLNEENIAVA